MFAELFQGRGSIGPITARDNAEIYYKDWGKGPVVTFSRGWPLCADTWDRSFFWPGMGSVASHTIVAATVAQPKQRPATIWTRTPTILPLSWRSSISGTQLLSVFRLGGGEVARYIGSHGTTRVKKAVPLSTIPPIMLKTTSDPEGLPIDGFDKLRADLTADRSQLYKDLAISFFGVNQPGAKVSKGVLDSSWLWSMQSGWPTVLLIFSNCSANAEHWPGFLQEMPLLTTFFPGPFVALSNFALTFRIETIPCADRVIIRLIGELDAESLPELEAQIGSGERSIEFEMDEVTLVDVDVVRFLISCEARGIQLRGCSRYIREWIRREQEKG